MTASQANVLFEASLRDHQAGRLAEARAGYERILAQNADHADALHMLGILLHQTGDRSEKPLKLVNQAIRLNPRAPEYRCNSGLILSDLRRWPQAVAEFNQALALRPDYAVVDNHLGNVLRAMGRLEPSAESYRRAVAIKPDFTDGWNNLANVLRELNRADESADACRRAIALNPNYAPAHNNLGNALLRQDKVDQAVVEYRRTLELEPENAKVISNLGGALKDLGELDESLELHRKALLLDPGLHECQSNLLYYSHYRQDFDPIVSLRESRDWAWRHTARLWRLFPPHGNSPEPERRIVVGYVSPDFRAHAVASFLLPLFQNHDHGKFEIIAYSNVRGTDRTTQLIRGLVDKWRDISGMSDAQAEDVIRRDAVDILVDLAGHTAQSRLLLMARNPAPVQTTYLGYPGTTGLPGIDYKLTDALADPPGLTESHYSETLLRLPWTNWCFTPIVDAPPVGPLPALSGSGSEKGASVCFGSFNNFAKVTPKVIEMWAAILRAVPNSRMLIKAKALSAGSVRQRVAKRFAELGVAEDRLDLRGRQLNPADHLATYNQVDIALDTFPYHGTTTTCEALWMGVPVVTLAGEAHLSRVGLSLLTNAGLQRLVAQSPEQYAQIAASLAKDLPALADLRAGLRQQMLESPLADGKAFARDVEGLYRQVWRNWCDGTAGTQRLERTIEHNRHIAQLHPEDGEVAFNLGSALYYLGETDSAVAAFEEAAQLCPDKPEVLANLASALQSRGEVGLAIEMFRRAIQLKPTFAEAHYNLGVALFLVGQFEEAWKEQEYRLFLPEARITPSPPNVPRWDGGDLAGRTLLVHAEQGLGDTIQFLRYVPEVIRRGGNVLLVVRRELEKLLQDENSQGAQVMSRLIIGSRPIHAHIPLMSLPFVLKIHPPLQMQSTYLKSAAEAAPIEQIAQAKGKKIGIAWAGNPQHKGDRLRSLPLSALAPLADVPAAFVSLQYGQTERQLKDSPISLIDVSERMQDFAETAAIIAGLDLIITVDTAIAHLAGAMGKPVWLLLPFAPDWRWMLDRSDTPWYPSVRLYRQPRARDWHTPIAAIINDLKKVPADANRENPCSLFTAH
jgi:predicted O-linked N-acetylglucosamine transferase (SPINDLY family)